MHLQFVVNFAHNTHYIHEVKSRNDVQLSHGWQHGDDVDDDDDDEDAMRMILQQI